MKNFDLLIQECLQELHAAGLKPGRIASWQVNRRARTRWGMCRKLPDGSFEIQIAARLLEDERISEKECKTTILHELLHTCRDSMKHTGNWRIAADRMNRMYGYSIKRVTSGAEKGVENHISRPRPAKYVFRCSVCGQMVYKTRSCKFTKYYRNYGCGICGSPRSFRRIETK